MIRTDYSVTNIFVLNILASVNILLIADLLTPLIWTGTEKYLDDYHIFLAPALLYLTFVIVLMLYLL